MKKVLTHCHFKSHCIETQHYFTLPLYQGCGLILEVLHFDNIQHWMRDWGLLLWHSLLKFIKQKNCNSKSICQLLSSFTIGTESWLAFSCLCVLVFRKKNRYTPSSHLWMPFSVRRCINRNRCLNHWFTKYSLGLTSLVFTEILLSFHHSFSLYIEWQVNFALTVPMAQRIPFLITAAKPSMNSMVVAQGSMQVVMMYLTGVSLLVSNWDGDGEKKQVHSK